MNGLAICAGVGGLELGLKLALGDAYRCVCYIEREGYAASVLVARMEDKALDTAPVWDDLATFDGRPWRGIVDLISAGFPCQPASTAGRRKGTDDDRWLWPHIKRIVCEVRPRLIFLENVPGLLNVNHGRAFAAILGDMAELGYDAEWEMFSAKGVGAPHLRKRVFILAVRTGDIDVAESVDRLGTALRQEANEESISWSTRPESSGDREELGDAEHIGLDIGEAPQEPDRDGTNDGLSRSADDDVADSGCDGRDWLQPDCEPRGGEATVACGDVQELADASGISKR